MDYYLKYGHTQIPFALPEKAEIIVPPILREAPPEPITLLDRALDRAEFSLEEYLQGAESLLIVVPDRTRRCALPVILPRIIESVIAAGVNPAGIKFLAASGTHLHIGRGAYNDLLGAEIAENYEIVEHDPDGDNPHIGATSRGTPVKVNRLVTGADKILAVGGMLPHYFAGFGGGPKLIIPGCAGRETIARNHALSLRLEPEWRPGMGAFDIDKNDLIQDIIEAVRMLNPVYHIGITLGEKEIPYRIFAGEVLSVYRRMAAAAKSLFGISGGEAADLVIVSPGGHPKDIDLLQTHKSMFHASASLKEGGRMAVLTECPGGIGSSTLSQLIDTGSLDEVKARLRQGYIVNGQAAVSLLKMGELFRVSMMTVLPDSVLAKLGFDRFLSSEELSRLTAEAVEWGGRVMAFPAASITLYNA